MWGSFIYPLSPWILLMSVRTIDNLEYENRNGVGVWTITDAPSYFQSESVEEGEAHYRKEASKDSMAATVVVIENSEALGSEMRDTIDHINEEWSQLADDVGIDRLAYVADGLMADTVKMKIEADVETESFDSVDDAVRWCQQA
jgi:hypothetical protein